jgi:AcrR family transcriptional regulator
MPSAWCSFPDPTYRQRVYFYQNIDAVSILDVEMPYPTRRRAPAASRAKVLAAVHDLLAAGAFHTATVEDIAERAGVARATVYQQFGSRLGLVDAMCEAFDATPALVAIRSVESLDEFVALCVAFWSSEEPVLEQLYGVAAVDPAAAALVERQRADRRGELERVLRLVVPKAVRRALPLLLLATSFETYVELRRHAGLSQREVTRTLQELARRAVAP